MLNIIEKQDTIAKVLAARLNHDYVSPLTAISNALEILKLYDDQEDMAMNLIEESVESALRELQFNRVAFGSFGVDEQLTAKDVERRICDYFHSQQTQIDVSQIKTPPLKADAKLWFLAIMCLRSSFLTLETLQIAPVAEGWQIKCAGTGMKDRNDEFRAEQHWLQVADMMPNMIHFPLLFIHAENLGYEIIFKRNDDLEIVLNLWNNG